MDKKYQVFVSSTYVDLLEERKEVIQALLELDCIPVGMELFPASDDDQWTFIQSVIDDCDYYVLILGGRYGSCSESGMGYTEMEYRYALETGKPIIAFVYKDPSQLAVSKTDQDQELSEKLGKFRELVQKKLCKYWETPAELGGVVGRSLVQLKKRSPAVGWVKADLLPDEDSSQEMLRLRKEIERLEEELEQASSSSTIDQTKLAQGDDLFEVSFMGEAGEFFERVSVPLTATYSWNTIFGELAPSLIDEESDIGLKNRLNAFLLRNHEDEVLRKCRGHHERPSCAIDSSSYETIVVQLRALNLIDKSTRNRSVKDKKTYWCLTTKGDQVMVGLRAIRRDDG
tara:strand:- start:100 stop:1128 length:1029 start_codon:yes stop_codon:yes gene_type:complete